MNADDFYTWGEPIAAADLRIDLSRALIQAVAKYPFATIVEVRRAGEREGIVVEFEAEIPQEPPVPIQSRERLAFVVAPDKNVAPLVCALRKDFPEVLHLNATAEGEPRQLCIFSEDYAEIGPYLTPRLLLDRVADWLARAAVEKLHLTTQPLEPFLLSADQIIFDKEIFEADADQQPLIAVFQFSEHPLVYRAVRLNADSAPAKSDSAHLYLALPLSCPPWHARLIRRVPTNLAELVATFRAAQLDIENEARQLLHRLYDLDRLEDFRKHYLLPIIRLPKIRREHGPVETTEWWACLIGAQVEELAIKLGFGSWTEGKFGTHIGPIQSSDLEKVPVLPLQATVSLSKEFAQRLSGNSPDDPKVVAIGAGSLGSQVILNLARQGWGSWSIIDDDLLLPHNLSRHGLSFRYEGHNKAWSLAVEVCGLLNSDDAAKAIPVNILRRPDDCLSALQGSDVILDLSAAHAVTRFLGEHGSRSPRICTFVSPDARFLVILSEGQERSVRIDDLEMQMLAAVAEDESLFGVFISLGDSIRYSGSCRDVTVQLPQDRLSIQAGVAAQFIKRTAFSISPSINIWEWSDSSLSMSRHQIPVCNILLRQAGQWQVRLSSHAADLMRYHRRRRLPNETGGVLLGKFDVDRRVLYVASVLPSPPDSVEWPDTYIRGVEGLRGKVEFVNKITGGELSYVGEWHSHPDGHGSGPSDDDHAAHRMIVGVMGKAGFPGIVFIQGDSLEPTLLIEDSP
jgi:proteasome lid subunit RPN8/RPN11